MRKPEGFAQAFADEAARLALTGGRTRRELAENPCVGAAARLLRLRLLHSRSQSHAPDRIGKRAITATSAACGHELWLGVANL